MKRWKLGAAVAALVLGGSVGEALAVPTSMMFSGRLSSPAGSLDGDHAVEFRFYREQSGGEPVWEEEYPQLMVQKGLVFAALGSKTTLDTELFDGEPLFLQVTVDGTPLLPRSPIGSVPYAFRAETADRLGELAPEDVQRRVEMGCEAGKFISKINADGTVVCVAPAVSAGDVSGVTAGTGLTGGGASGDVSVSVDFTKTQARVLGTCSLGEFVQKINQDGAVSCGAGGDITAVTAGFGLTGGAASGSAALAVDTAAVQARVTGTCAGGQAIASIGSTGAVTCSPAPSGDISSVTAGVGLTGGAASGNATLEVNPLDFFRQDFAVDDELHDEMNNSGGSGILRETITSVTIDVPAAGNIIVHAASNVAHMNPSASIKSAEWALTICSVEPTGSNGCPSAGGSDMLGRFNFSGDSDGLYYYAASTFGEFHVSAPGTYTFYLRGHALGGQWMRYSRSKLLAEWHRDPVE